MLFRRIKIEDEIRRVLILTKLDYKQKEMMYEQMETQGLEAYR